MENNVCYNNYSLFQINEYLIYFSCIKVVDLVQTEYAPGIKHKLIQVLKKFKVKLYQSEFIQHFLKLKLMYYIEKTKFL